MASYNTATYIIFKYSFPYQIKYNYIHDKVKSLKEDAIFMNRRIEYLCFILQYKKMNSQKKRDFNKITVTKDNFYIEKVSDYCAVDKSSPLSYHHMWETQNQTRLSKWELDTDFYLSEYYRLDFFQLEYVVKEIHAKIKGKSNYFVVKEKLGSKEKINRYLVRLNRQEGCFPSILLLLIVALFWLTMFYLLMFLVIAFVSFLRLFISEGRDVVTSVILGSIIILILVTINLLLFSGVVVLSYPYIRKERLFEKKYRERFFEKIK